MADEGKKELQPELKAFLDKTKVAKLEGTKETTLMFYLEDGLQELVKEALPYLRRGDTMTFQTKALPPFNKVKVWLEKQEAYFHRYSSIYHPDGEGRVLMVENLEVRYPDYPTAKDSYIIRVFWEKQENEELALQSERK